MQRNSIGNVKISDADLIKLPDDIASKTLGKGSSSYVQLYLYKGDIPELQATSYYHPTLGKGYLIAVKILNQENKHEAKACWEFLNRMRENKKKVSSRVIASIPFFSQALNKHCMISSYVPYQDANESSHLKKKNPNEMNSYNPLTEKKHADLSSFPKYESPYFKNDHLMITLVQLLAQMFAAVNELHEQGMVHNDISLRNFLLKYINTKFSLRLTDLGLARVLPESGVYQLEDDSTIPTRWLPLISRSKKLLSIYSDLYALNATIIELIGESAGIAKHKLLRINDDEDNVERIGEVLSHPQYQGVQKEMAPLIIFCEERNKLKSDENVLKAMLAYVANHSNVKASKELSLFIQLCNELITSPIGSKNPPHLLKDEKVYSYTADENYLMRIHYRERLADLIDRIKEIYAKSKDPEIQKRLRNILNVRGFYITKMDTNKVNSQKNALPKTAASFTSSSVTKKTETPTTKLLSNSSMGEVTYFKELSLKIKERYSAQQVNDETIPKLNIPVMKKKNPLPSSSNADGLTTSSATLFSNGRPRSHTGYTRTPKTTGDSKIGIRDSHPVKGTSAYDKTPSNIKGDNELTRSHLNSTHSRVHHAEAKKLTQ